MSHTGKDLESNTCTATPAPSPSKSKKMIYLAAGTAIMGLFIFAVGAGTGAAGTAIALLSKQSELTSLTSPDNHAWEDAELQRLSKGVNFTAARLLDNEFEALKTTGVQEPPEISEEELLQMSGNETRGRQMTSIWTPVPGNNRLSKYIARDNAYTLWVRSKLRTLERLCPYVDWVYAQGAYAVWWTEAYNGIKPGHFRNFCKWKDHVKLMYTVKYKFGQYAKRGKNVVPSTDKKTTVQFKYGVTYTQQRETTSKFGTEISANMGAEISKGLTAGATTKFTAEFSERHFFESVVSRETATEMTNTVAYVEGVPCMNKAQTLHKASAQGQPHYQFEYVVRYADGHELAVQKDIIFDCFLCGDPERFEYWRYKEAGDTAEDQCPPLRMAPLDFKLMQKQEPKLCYKMELESLSTACKDKDLNVKLWD